MIKTATNKGICFISIGTIGIIAALSKEWHIVTTILVGLFALLNITDSEVQSHGNKSINK